MAWEWGDHGDYVSADEKRRRAGTAARKLEKTGRKLSPVLLIGRFIAESFWSKAWCKNLEGYSDYASRLPRGRSYLRQGAVLDLQISRGTIQATVSGTRLYEVGIKIDTLAKDTWTRLKADCAGKVGSLMELLQGKLAAPVMEVVTRADRGLFPKPKEIHLECSCPDWADLCKHVAAVLYGVSTRLDERPELLFVLRGVDHLELIASATRIVTDDLMAPPTGKGNTLEESSLTEIFGIEIDPAIPDAPGRARFPKPPARATRKTAARRTAMPSARPPSKKAKAPKPVAVAKKPPQTGSKVKKRANAPAYSPAAKPARKARRASCQEPSAAQRSSSLRSKSGSK